MDRVLGWNRVSVGQGYGWNRVWAEMRFWTGIRFRLDRVPLEYGLGLNKVLGWIGF